MKNLLNINGNVNELENKYLIKNGNQCKIVDIEKGIVFPNGKNSWFDNMPMMHNDYIFGRINGYGIVLDKNYNVLTPKDINIENCYTMISDGMLSVKVDGNWNYLNVTTGKLIINSNDKIYDALPFKNNYGVIRIEKNGNCFSTLVDMNGNIVLKNETYKFLRVPIKDGKFFVAYFIDENGDTKLNLIDHNENILREEYFKRYIGIVGNNIHVTDFDNKHYLIDIDTLKRIEM